jgi:hypothetical protein
MKQDVHPLAIVAAVVVLVGVVFGAFMYFTKPRIPSDVKYTPGVPPWAEKQAGGKPGAPGAGYDPRRTP